MRMKTSRVRVDQKMRLPFECISWCSPSGTWEKSASSIAAVNRITRERERRRTTQEESFATDYTDEHGSFSDPCESVFIRGYFINLPISRQVMSLMLFS